MDRPTYLGSERADDLARMITELASEVWVLRDRVTIMEHVLEKNGVLTRHTLDTYVPDADLAEELAAARKELIERVLGAPFRSATGS
jgi:hypothetical protein